MVVSDWHPRFTSPFFQGSIFFARSETPNEYSKSESSSNRWFDRVHVSIGPWKTLRVCERSWTIGSLTGIRFFESFLWHFNKKQRAEVIFWPSRPVSCKNQENGSGKQWSNKSSCGSDEISYCLMKEAGPALVGPLVTLFNRSLLLRQVPDEWKKAIVIPIFKGGRKDRQEPSSYRPISLTSCVARTMEKIVHAIKDPEFLHDKHFSVPTPIWSFANSFNHYTTGVSSPQVANGFGQRWINWVCLSWP